MSDNAYGAGGYNQPVIHEQQIQSEAAQPAGLSISSFVVGLSSLIIGWTFLVPIVAIILGVFGLKKEPAGRRFAIAGIVLGGISLIFGALLVIFCIAFFTILMALIAAMVARLGTF